MAFVRFFTLDSPNRCISSMTRSATDLTQLRVCQLRLTPSHFSGVVTIKSAAPMALKSGVTSPVNSTTLPSQTEQGLQEHNKRHYLNSIKEKKWKETKIGSPTFRSFLRTEMTETFIEKSLVSEERQKSKRSIYKALGKKEVNVQQVHSSSWEATQFSCG